MGKALKDLEENVDPFAWVYRTLDRYGNCFVSASTYKKLNLNKLGKHTTSLVKRDEWMVKGFVIKRINEKCEIRRKEMDSKEIIEIIETKMATAEADYRNNKVASQRFYILGELAAYQDLLIIIEQMELKDKSE